VHVWLVVVSHVRFQIRLPLLPNKRRNDVYNGRRAPQNVHIDEFLTSYVHYNWWLVNDLHSFLHREVIITHGRKCNFFKSNWHLRLIDISRKQCIPLVTQLLVMLLHSFYIIGTDMNTRKMINHLHPHCLAFHTPQKSSGRLLSK